MNPVFLGFNLHLQPWNKIENNCQEMPCSCIQGSTQLLFVYCGSVFQLFDKILIANRGEIACRVSEKKNTINSGY